MSEYLGLVIERREKDMKPCDHPKGYYHGNGDSYCEFFFTAQHHISLLMKRIAAQQARIEALEAERRWIPVSERLPPYGEIVLTSTGGKYPAIDYLKPNNLFTADHVCEPQFNVKYWMPCPEPPELEGE